MQTGSISITTVYTFAMPKYVYVQMSGVQQPAKVEGDSVRDAHGGENQLVVMLNGQPVGEFQKTAVMGWWMEDTPSK